MGRRHRPAGGLSSSLFGGGPSGLQEAMVLFCGSVLGGGAHAVPAQKNGAQPISRSNSVLPLPCVSHEAGTLFSTRMAPGTLPGTFSVSMGHDVLFTELLLFFFIFIFFLMLLFIFGTERDRA